MTSTSTSPAFIMLTAQEVAERLRISAATVYKLSVEGKLPSVRIGRRIGILESDLINYVEVNRYPQSTGLTHVR